MADGQLAGTHLSLLLFIRGRLDCFSAGRHQAGWAWWSSLRDVCV